MQYKYLYDDLGQLIREDNRPLGVSYVYTYDNAGNIKSKVKHAFTTGNLGAAQGTSNFGYNNSNWRDLLTSVGGKYIDYDDIGNPTMIYTDDDGMMSGYTYQWEGRELQSICNFYGESGFIYDETEYVSFTYNADGIRTSKTVNGTTYNYILNSSQVLAVKWGIYTVEFVYDEVGAPLGLKYRTTGMAQGVYNCYFFEKNLQGDIVAIYNSSGTKIATYTYDAWGKVTCTTASVATTLEKNIANTYNPFRYRGYFYDVETGWYYLQSRYYDPTWGRFINPDNSDVITATPTELTDKNLFAYCDNNPITRMDADGEFWNIVIGAAVGAVVGAVASAVTQLIGNSASWKTGEFWAHVGVAAGVGAVSGGLAASGVGLGGQIAVNAALGAAGAIADTGIDDNGETSEAAYVMAAIEGATRGGISGMIGGKGSASKHVTNSFKRFVKNGNWSYYYSQVRTQAIRDGKKAIPSIFKATIPSITKPIIKSIVQYGGY